MKKVLEKKALPAVPHPHRHRLTSPSLKRAAMMAGAEKGRGAILSTHKRGLQFWELFTHSFKPSQKHPWL